MGIAKQSRGIVVDVEEEGLVELANLPLNGRQVRIR